jgi:hypothetical protein
VATRPTEGASPAEPVRRRLRVIAPVLAAAALCAGTLGLVGVAGAQSVSLSDLTFISPSVGWLRVSPANGLAGSLYHTANGGASWTLVSSHIEATSMVFRNKLDGEALVPVYGSEGMCQVNLTAVETTDGGALWEAPAAVHTQDAPSVLAFHGTRPFLLNGSCATPYATLMGPEAGAKWANVGELGANATKNGFPSVVSLTPSGSFATLAYPVYPAGQSSVLRGFVYRAQSHSWHMVDIASTGLPGRVIAASFVNASAGVVATTNSEGTSVTLWSTQNGGQAWTKDLSVAGAGGQVELDVVNPSVAYAAVTTASVAHVYKSTDAGQHWTALPLPM